MLVVPETVTKPQVEAAQRSWAEGLLEIGQLHRSDGDFRSRAQAYIEEHYGFDAGPVLFKPTMALKLPFRTSKAGALSYFIGGDENFDEDLGFALIPWASVRFENEVLRLDTKAAMAMGNYFFADLDGEETRIEYSFVYKIDAAGSLRITLHHSSFPFSRK
jgi:hypothetical protein